MNMAKVSAKRTTVEKIEIEFPDHYSWDDSVRGQIVDKLLLLQGYSNNTRGYDLYHNDEQVVLDAIRRLKELYCVADDILFLVTRAKI